MTHPPMTKDHAGLVERLRQSAREIREHVPDAVSSFHAVATSEADPHRQMVAGPLHADLLDEAADLIDSIMSAGPIPEHAALHARFRTMLSGPFINLHIRRDIEMAEKVLESIPAMLEQARAEGREEAMMGSKEGRAASPNRLSSPTEPLSAQGLGPTGFDPARKETYALGLMVEEMGETLKIIGKAMRFGIDAPGPRTPEYRGLTAREMLPFEVGDLHAAIRFAAMAGVFRMSAANVAEEDKLAKLLNPDSRDANGNRLAPAIGMAPKAETACPAPVPQDRQARAEGIAQKDTP